MNNEFESMGKSEFSGKTAQEILDEWLDECPIVSDGVYVNFYGASFTTFMKILPTSMKVFLWMVFNSELEKGRVTIQSLTQKRLLKECQISQVAYFKCLRDLKANNMIRGFRAVYFINPNFAWRGTHKNRMRFIEQYPYVQNERLTKNAIKTENF
jgi:hypothetical protein